MVKSLLATVVVGALALTACERPGTETTRSTGDTDATTADAGATTPAPAETTSPTTDPTVTTVDPEPTTATTAASGSDDTAPSSTTASSEPPATTRPDPTSPADLVLSFDGVEPYLFGQPDGEVVEGLVALLGDPVDDVAAEYPSPDDEGMFLTDDESLAFVFPFGRTVCFDNGLCTEFGAGADSALLFTGWKFAGADAAGLSTADGITVGSNWADHADVIEVDEGGCFQEGYGRASGLDLVLVSAGDPFVATDDSGNQTPQTPDASSVSVTAMSAGELPESLEGDC